MGANKKIIEAKIDNDLVASRILQLIQDNDDYVGHVSTSIGYTRNTLYNITKGRVAPSIGVVYALCKYYDGVSADWLLGLTGKRYR